MLADVLAPGAAQVAPGSSWSPIVSRAPLVRTFGSMMCLLTARAVSGPSLAPVGAREPGFSHHKGGGGPAPLRVGAGRRVVAFIAKRTRAS
jgi:hypothetical protein